jgi:hypothetical protein
MVGPALRSIDRALTPVAGEKVQDLASIVDAPTLDPVPPPLGDLLSAAATVAAHFPGGDAAAAAGWLRAAAEHLRGGPARVVFGGHFSCGKSTLLNALIRRRLLPSSMFPETGVPCWLQAGPVDSAVAIGDAGPVPLSVDRDAIGREVSLLDDRQQVRAHIRAVHRVEIRLRDADLPPGAVWLDSPGINDDSLGADGGPGVTERASAIADAADVLCWVVPSHHAFSLIEQEFLAEYLRRHPPGGLVFVVNVFLDEDDEACWRDFLAGSDARGIRNRLDRMVDELIGDPRDGLPQPRPPFVFAAARAALRVDPEGFGLAHLRALLREAHDGSAWIAAVRRELAADAITQATGFTRSLAEAERNRITLARHACAATRTAHDKAIDRFECEVRTVVESQLATALGEVDALRTIVLTEINSEPLDRDGRYGRLCDTRLAEITAALASGLVSHVSDRAAALRLAQVDPGTHAEIEQRVRPEPVEIPVPTSQAVVAAGLGAAAGALAGAAMGSVIPIIGTIGGAIWGGIVGGTTGESVGEGKVDARDREAARAHARTALGQARDRLAEQADGVLDTLQRGGRPLAPLPEPPDPAGLTALERLLDQLAASPLPELAHSSADHSPVDHLPARHPLPAAPERPVMPPPTPYLTRVPWRLVVAGPRRSGKSTLIHALLADGSLPPADAVQVIEAPSTGADATLAAALREASGVLVVLCSEHLLGPDDLHLLRSLPRSTPTLVLVNLFAVATELARSQVARFVWQRLVQAEWGGPPWSPTSDLTDYGIHLVELTARGEQAAADRSGLPAVSTLLHAEIQRQHHEVLSVAASR